MRKISCFWYSCIWIRIANLSLLRTIYFSTAPNNVLTSSCKILHVNKRDFCQLNWLGSDQWIWQRCCDADFSSAFAGFQCCLFKGPLKRDFLYIYLRTFLESVTSEIEKRWVSSLFSKCLKFNLDFKNSAKNSENIFCFSDKCIWIGIIKFFLIRVEYISSAANVLLRSPNIWYLNFRDFFWLNWLGRDHRIT